MPQEWNPPVEPSYTAVKFENTMSQPIFTQATANLRWYGGVLEQMFLVAGMPCTSP